MREDGLDAGLQFVLPLIGVVNVAWLQVSVFDLDVVVLTQVLPRVHHLELIALGEYCRDKVTARKSCLW